MAKVNYNGTTSLGASAQVAPEHNARTRFFFKNPAASGQTMVLNFGATATADNILAIEAGASIFLTKVDPYPIEKQINVFCAAAVKYQAQAEE